MRSSLAALQPTRRLDAHELRDRAVRCWREHELVVIRLADVRDPAAREVIAAEAERLYGRRSGGR